MFMLPSGNAGREFLKEMKKLIDDFVNKTSFYNVALNAVMVMVPLLQPEPL